MQQAPQAHLEPMEDTMTNITPPRVARIEAILLKYPVFKQLITSKKGDNGATLKTRDGKPILFHPEAIRVVQAIHSSPNRDAYTIGKGDVLKIAEEVLQVNGTVTTKAV